MKRMMMIFAASCLITAASAQTYQVPVSEAHEKMQTGQYEPTWESHARCIWKGVVNISGM